MKEGQTIYNQTEILRYVKLFYETPCADNDSNLVDVDRENTISEKNALKLGIHLTKKLEADMEESEIINVLKHEK